MANLKSEYGTSNQAITVTLASLASTSARASTAIDNTSNKFLDALVFLNVKTGASGLAAPFMVYIWAYGTADGGTNYTENASGTDGALTLTVPTNLHAIGWISAPTAATTYKGGPFSVANGFGGRLPDHWGIVVENRTGAALDSSEGNHAKFYQGVYASVT